MRVCTGAQLLSRTPLPPSPLSRPAAKARLASAVQYLPLPAVGGYLSYVGAFARLEGSFDACIHPKAGLVQMESARATL